MRRTAKLELASVVLIAQMTSVLALSAQGAPLADSTSQSLTPISSTSSR